VLGGIGPEATNEFYRNLIDKIQKNGIKNNMDFPQIIINSIPAPELIYDKISEHNLKPYIDGLKELESFGVDFIVMVCNTVHLFFDRLQNLIRIPIIDLRKEVKDYITKNKLKRVLVIGTPLSVKQELYGDLIRPSDEELRVLSECIFNFNRGFEKQKQINRVKKICKRDVDAVLLGCTEFAVMLEQQKFPKIDTLEILAEATSRYIIQKSKIKGGYNARQN